MYLDLLNNIIIGINELYVCKYLLDLDLTLMNIWRDNYCLENDYDSKTKLSIIFSTLQYKAHEQDVRIWVDPVNHLHQVINFIMVTDYQSQCLQIFWNIT